LFDDLTRPERNNRMHLIGSMVWSVPSTIRSILPNQTPTCDR
jgi:hypothetical protein